MADGSVIFDTKINLAGLKKGKAHIKQLMTDLAVNANKIKDIQSKMQGLENATVPTDEYKNLQAELEKVEEKFALLDEKQKKLAAIGVSETSSRWKTVQYEIEQTDNNLTQLLARKKELESSGAAYTVGVNTEEYRELGRSLDDARNKSRDLNAELRKTRFTNTGHVLAIGLKGAANAAAKMVITLKKGVSSFAKLTFGSKNLSKSFGGVTRSVKTLIPALLGARGVLGILRRAVSAFMQENQQLSATLSGVWSGLGNLIGPIVERIIGLVSRAVAYITQFFALLGVVGKKTNSAIKGAGGSAKKETDKLKKQIMAFDELNILQSDKDSDTGGGGSGTPPPITPNVTLPDWAKLMAEQIKAGQWAEAATTLTTELNRMVDSIDWAGLGQKLGRGIDNALSFLATFIMTFDWFNLGSKLAVGLNNVLTSVDWTNLGIVLGAKFKILIEGLGGFFATFNWAALGFALSQAITGLFNSIDWAQAAMTLSIGLIGLLNTITVFIQETDWQQIGNQISLFLSTIDWTGLVTALMMGIGAALAGIAELIWGLIEQAWSNVVTWWNETAYEDGQFTIEGLLGGIVDALANIGTWINDHIFKPFIDGFKNAFGIHSPSTVMQEQGGFIIEGLLNGIRLAWQRVTAFFQPAVDGIKQIFNGLITFFHGIFAGSWSQVWSGIVGIAKGAINGVIGVVNNLISAVTNGINALFRLLSFDIPLPFGGSIGLSLPQVSAPQIPYLAKGAVIPPNAPFAAVLGDQRHGNNIEAPEDLIRRIVREETAGRGDDQLAALLEELIAVVGNIQVGDDVIGRAAQRYARHSERARGW